MRFQDELDARNIPYCEITPHQIRIRGELDIWLKRGKWHDIVMNERGQCSDSLIDFVENFFKHGREQVVNQEAAVDFLVRTGWDEKEARKEVKKAQDNELA